jgi:hypothetical protein
MLEKHRAGAQPAPDQSAGNTTMQNLQRDAQAALDDLWAAHEIPFKLTAYEIGLAGKPDYYTLQFHDSRLPLLFIYQNPKESFKAAVREGVERTVGKRRSV